MFTIPLALFFLIISTIAVHVPERRATVCNGHAELCGRSYGNVTFLTSHDSYAFSEDPLALARDQEIDLTAQMTLGVRGLQAQSHMNNGVLHFCHTSCSLFDGGTVLAYLQTVKSFMDANPNEVFTFIFTNPEGVSPLDVWDPIFQQSGIASMVYTPPHLPMKASEWPTLGEMIDSGQRIVVFMDYSSDPAEVPYILPEFDNVWETPFDSTDPTFPCSVNRISGPLSPQDHMFMINHNLDVQIFPSSLKRSPLPQQTPDSVLYSGLTIAVGQITSELGSVVSSAAQAVSSVISSASSELSSILIPDYIQAPTTNSVASILANSNGCAPYSGGKAPSFVLLDFVDIGEGMKAVDILNGLA